LTKQRGVPSSLSLAPPSPYPVPPPSFLTLDRKKNRLERQLENVQYEVNYNSREIFKRYEKSAELLVMRDEWCKTEIKKEKLKQKTLKLAQRVILKSMKEAEDLQRKCNQRLSTMKFDELDEGAEDESVGREEEWMMQEEEEELSPTRRQRSQQAAGQESEEKEEEEDYNTAWMITQMRYPTITGDLRGRILTNEDKGRKRRGESSLIPQQISISMTQHR
jgi:hypothetical protein